MFLYRSNNNVIEYCCSGILHDWDMSFEKLGGQPTFWGLTAKDRDKFVFKIWAPTSSMKCPTSLDLKFHWTQCVIGNYNRMGPIAIGLQYTTQISFIMEVWVTFIDIHLTRELAASTVLTHWGRDKMAAVSLTILSNTFSWMKMLEFRLRFHWSLSLRVQLTIIQHWFR